nr:O-acetyl-ADP-ribose deacetylase [Sneathiella chinensis]
MQCWRGDITTLAVDAIVNAANESLLGGGGVDGAIHRAAGSDLLEFCRTLGGCPTGQARLTPGFNLPARHVIHRVGPVWHGGQRGEADLLAQRYMNSLRLAHETGLETLSFPAISTGVFGFPAKSAAAIAVQTLLECGRAGDLSVREITLVAFSEQDHSILTHAITTHQAL